MHLQELLPAAQANVMSMSFGAVQVLTPVRRSVRKAQTPAADASDMLHRTSYTYAPNNAMQPRLDPNTPLGDATRVACMINSADTKMSEE